MFTIIRASAGFKTKKDGQCFIFKKVLRIFGYICAKRGDRNEARKAEEGDEEDDSEKLTIFSNDPSPLKLDALEIESLPELPKTPSSPSLKSSVHLKKDVLDIQTLK